MNHVTNISTEKETTVANVLGGILQQHTLTQQGLTELNNKTLPVGAPVTEIVDVPIQGFGTPIPKKKVLPIFIQKKGISTIVWAGK